MITTTDNKLTITNFKVPANHIVFANDKRTAIQIGEGQLSVPTNFVFKEDAMNASVGIAVEWNYYFSAKKGAQGQEVAGKDVIAALNKVFDKVSKKTAFEIATSK